MKIDCSKAENYFREKKRMTKDCTIDCSNCPLAHSNNPRGYNCSFFELKSTRDAIEEVQKWSDEHPLKTYKDDFFERFPDAPKKADGYPKMSPCDIYRQLRDMCCHSGCCCTNCWDMTMEE